MKTLLLDIMVAVRSGLNLRPQDYVGAHYTNSSLLTLFRWIDGKLYSIEIKEIKEEL